MNNIINKKWILIASGIFLMLVLSFYVFYPVLNPAQIIDNKDINYNEKLSGFASGTTIKIEYTAKDNVILKEIFINNDNPVTSNNSAEKLLQNSERYSVHYTAQIPNQDYSDIDLTINKKSNKITAMLSGLPPKSKISLDLNQARYFTDVQTDWAGRLTLQLNNMSALNDSEACLTIKTTRQDNPLSICHHIVDAAERQAS